MWVLGDFEMRRKSDERPSYSRGKQGELFAEFPAARTKKTGHFFRQDIAFGKKITLNLSYENLVLFFIIFIMLLVVSFSLGVEKGRGLIVGNDKVRTTGHIHKAVAKKAPATEEKNEIILSEKGGSNMPEIVVSSEIIENKIIEASTKPYTIQVIAFKKEDRRVEIEIERLKKEGYEVFIMPSKEWAQVCVGRYANKKSSTEDLGILRKRYPTCYIRKINK